MSNQSKEVAIKEKTVSERFTEMIVSEFNSVVGTGVQYNADKRRLAQHLYIKTDAALKELEAYRAAHNPNNVPIVWNNINMEKMALDAIHRIELGLDALVEGHIYPIPYFNNKSGKYDLDLRIGYIGKDYYRRKFAIDKPKNVIYQLVHANDIFTVFPKDKDNRVESFTLKIDKPFDRGEVVGGFGYLEFDDESKNKIILVPKSEMDKAEKLAGSKKFWGPWSDRMQLKTIVNIVTHSRNMPIDPQKVSESFFIVEESDKDDFIEAGVDREEPNVTIADKFKPKYDVKLVEEKKEEQKPELGEWASKLASIVADPEFNYTIDLMIESGDIMEGAIRSTDESRAKAVYEQIIKTKKSVETDQKDKNDPTNIDDRESRPGTRP